MVDSVKNGDPKKEGGKLRRGERVNDDGLGNREEKGQEDVYAILGTNREERRVEE